MEKTLERGMEHRVRRIVQLKRLPNGHFAPRGQGEVLRVGDHVRVPHPSGAGQAKGVVEDAADGLRINIQSGPESGKKVRVSAAGNFGPRTKEETDPGVTPHGDLGDRIHAKIGEKPKKDDKPAPPASPGTVQSKFGAGGSPGRGPTGKLRNFKAMSSAKLKQTIKDLENFGEDPEALAAVKAVAKDKGVAWNDARKVAHGGGPMLAEVTPKATDTLAANKAKKDAEISKAILSGAGEMGPNKGNLSLKDLPLGTKFQMNDGKEFVLHKAVGDPFMIVKPTDGGKAKPLHKMFAPAQVGPIAPGYEGSKLPEFGPTKASDPGKPEGEDDLFGKLAASVEVAQDAKAKGEKPDFEHAGDEDEKAKKKAALAAYKAMGGSDPVVIKALQEGRLELREDWASWDEKRRAGLHGLGRSMRTTFQVRRPGVGPPQSSDPAGSFAGELKKLKKGESYAVPMPEGQMTVTHLGSKHGLPRFHVSGGGQNHDPDLRRGSREIPGRNLTAREMSERVRGATHADFAHTAHATGRVLSAQPHENVDVFSLNGHRGTIQRRGDGFHVKGDEIQHRVHPTADGAVRDLKRQLRSKHGAEFLEQGHRTDPLSVETPEGIAQDHLEATMKDQNTIERFHKAIEKVNPDGAYGDTLPDKALELIRGHPMTATPTSLGGTGSGDSVERAVDAVHRFGSNLPAAPASPGTGIGHGVAAHVATQVAPHVHHVVPLAHTLTHLLTARVEDERANVSRLEESGATSELLRARARLRAAQQRLAAVS